MSSTAMGSMKKLQDEHDDHLLVHVSPGLSSITQDPSHGSKKRVQQCVVRDEGGDEEDATGDDELSNPSEKKRKLTVEQVKYLEMSFNADLKLEPERKALIAKKLGIRPRQVAIWFQNRRARWKNKQLEQDFENLKIKYEAELKEKENRIREYQLILEENKVLQVEVARLKGLLQGVENSVMPNTQSDDGLVKEEEVSGKSEVASPTKSFEGQSEMQDSGQSYVTPDAAYTFRADSSFELHVPISSNHHKNEYQSPSFAATEDIFGSLIQHLQSNGFDIEEAAFGLSFNYDDQFHGLSWNGY